MLNLSSSSSDSPKNSDFKPTLKKTAPKPFRGQIPLAKM